MSFGRFSLLSALLLLVIPGNAARASEGRPGLPSWMEVTCFQPFPETEELGAEVVLPTGFRDMGDGTIAHVSESFTFQQGETYLLFGRGDSTDGMTTSVCQPNSSGQAGSCGV